MKPKISSEVIGEGTSPWRRTTRIEPAWIASRKPRRRGRSRSSSRHSRKVSITIGKSGNCRATWSRSLARSRWSQSGVRFAGSGRGISSARPAFWRNRRPNSAVSGSSSRISSSASSPVRPSKRSSGGSSRFGRRKSRPSSPCRQAGVTPSRSADPRQQGELQPVVQLAAERREHGQAELAGLVVERLDQDRAVVGDRAAPAAAGGRGTARASARPSARAGTRARATGAARDRPAAPAISRQSAPTASPSSGERDAASPRQNGITAGWPSARLTSTRWGSMASIRQAALPSMKVSPTRRSKTNSSSSSPSRGPPSPR